MVKQRRSGACLRAAATTAVKDVNPLLAGTKPSRAVKIAVTVVAGLSAALALAKSPVVFTFVLYAWSGLGASLGPAILYCAIFKAPRALAALAGMVVGGVVAIAANANALNLLYAFGAAVTAIAVFHAVAGRMNRNSAPS